MKECWLAPSIIAALSAPVIASAIATELYYVLNLRFEYLSFSIFVIFQILALIVLFKILNWKLWVKILASIPLIALSLAITVYVSLVVAAANGDGL
jgi:hypothetical protein